MCPVYSMWYAHPVVCVRWCPSRTIRANTRDDGRGIDRRNTTLPGTQKRNPEKRKTTRSTLVIVLYIRYMRYTLATVFTGQRTSRRLTARTSTSRARRACMCVCVCIARGVNRPNTTARALSYAPRLRIPHDCRRGGREPPTPPMPTPLIGQCHLTDDRRRRRRRRPGSVRSADPAHVTPVKRENVHFFFEFFSYFCRRDSVHRRNVRGQRDARGHPSRSSVRFFSSGKFADIILNASFFETCNDSIRAVNYKTEKITDKRSVDSKRLRCTKN